MGNPASIQPGSLSDVFLDLGMVLTLNDNGKLGILVAYCLNVLKKANE